MHVVATVGPRRMQVELSSPKGQVAKFSLRRGGDLVVSARRLAAYVQHLGDRTGRAVHEAKLVIDPTLGDGTPADWLSTAVTQRVSDWFGNESIPSTLGDSLALFGKVQDASPAESAALKAARDKSGLRDRDFLYVHWDKDGVSLVPVMRRNGEPYCKQARGHIPVDSNTQTDCVCGVLCLNKLISGRTIHKQYGGMNERSLAPHLEEIADAMAQALHLAMSFCQVDTIVLGGYVSRLGRLVRLVDGKFLRRWGLDRWRQLPRDQRGPLPELITCDTDALRVLPLVGVN